MYVRGRVLCSFCYNTRYVKLLVIDVGNTSTAVGHWSNGRVSLVSHIDHRVKKNDEEILAAVDRISDGDSPRKDEKTR